MAGLCDDDTLATLYAASDLLIWPAVREGYGMAILEAQCAGLPAVVGHTPGVAAIVADGTTGRVVRNGDAGAFAAAIDELLLDTSRRHHMSAAARSKIRREHDIASAALVLDNAISSLSCTTSS